MPVSAYDVARLAGVSQAAVSRSFTPGGRVSKEMRDKVLKAADTLGYRPNLIARSLSLGRSDIIGIVFGIPEMAAHVATFKALSSRLVAAGKQIMVFTTDERDYVADVHIEDLLKYRIDALVLISANIAPAVAAQCRETGIPVISVTRLTRMTDHMRGVTVASADAAATIVDHLAGQGYRQLTFMAGNADSVTNRERERAFFARAAAIGLPAPFRHAGGFRRPEAIEGAREILSGEQRPEAIFCATDNMALATIEVARHEFGLTIGRELGIVGFDDIPQAAWRDFDLTSFTQPVDAMADRVVDMLLGEARSDPTPISEFPGVLVPRGSTRRA